MSPVPMGEVDLLTTIGAWPLSDARHGTGRGAQVAQVGCAAQRLGRVDREEDELRLRDGLLVGGREAQATLGQAVCDELRQAFLLDSEDAASQSLDEVQDRGPGR